MTQALMFGLRIRPRTTRPFQAPLRFRGAIESGRRGEPSSTWLDAVCATVARATGRAVDLCSLQSAWDAGRSAADTALDLIADRDCRCPSNRAGVRLRHRPAVALPWVTLVMLPPPRALLGLPSPTVRLDNPTPDPFDRARKLISAGISQRSAARRVGLPISTLRDALGYNTNGRAI